MIGLKVDNIYELTPLTGVTIEGIKLDSSTITLVNSINEFSIDGTLTGNSDSVIPTEKAVKTYIDTYEQGVIWKASVKAATLGNVPLTAGLSPANLDTTVSLLENDRVLVRAQTDPKENGLYNAKAAAVWTRTLDFDEWSEIVSSAIPVEEGDTHGDTTHICIEDIGGTVGSNNITFTQMASTFNHNILNNLQGGTTNQYYHLTNFQHLELTGWMGASILLNDGSIDMSATGILKTNTITESTAVGVSIMDININDAVISAPSVTLKTTGGSGRIIMHDNAGLPVFQYSDSANLFVFNNDVDMTSDLKVNFINFYNALAGVNIEGTYFLSNKIDCQGQMLIDTIIEHTPTSGVTIESILCKDGHLEITPTDTSDGIYLSANTNDDTIFNMDKPATTDDCKILYKTGGSPLFTTGLIGDDSFTIYNDTTTSNSLTINTATNLIIMPNGSLHVNSVESSYFTTCKLQVFGNSQTCVTFQTATAAASTSANLNMVRTRGTIDSFSAVQDNDIIGAINFIGSSSGINYNYGAQITAEINGTVSAGILPCDLIFETNVGSGSPAEGMRLDKNKNLTIKGNLLVNQVLERTGGTGVTVDSVLIKDGMIDINPTGATAGLNIYGNSGGNATIEMFKDTTADSINITLYDASTSLKFRMDLDTSNDFNIYNHAQTSNIITLPTASDFLVLPTTYANTVTTSVRNLFIDSNGLVGGISSVLASKTNIDDILDTDFIDNIKIKTYNYRKKDKDKKYTEEAEDEVQIGIIAENLELLVLNKSDMHKDLLTYDKIKDHTDECTGDKDRVCECPAHNKLASVNYYKFIPLLIKYTQDLKIENNAIKTRLDNLEK